MTNRRRDTGCGGRWKRKYRIVGGGLGGSGAGALRCASKPDLVLLDVVMPGQDGLSFLKWMRDREGRVPVLMVSALDTAKTAVRSAAAWRGGLSGERIRIGRVAAARGQSAEAGDAGKGK